jgi:hypothetical protein
MKKSFENWLWQEIEESFGLAQKELPLLQEWLDNSSEIPASEREQVKFLQTILINNFRDWNEDELKMQFIAPLLLLINYYEIADYKAFSQRTLSAQIDKAEIYGRVDWMLAKGKQIPRKPFFLIHEYKSERGKDNDPQGQLLAEMLVAQTKNEDGKAIYGIYVIGKDWYFVVLKDKHYSVSRPYQANETPDLDVIVKALKEIKNIVKNYA